MFKFTLIAGASALRLQGNATGNATASTLPYGQTDYGVAGGVAGHAETMDQANIWEKQRVAAVNGQQSGDAWRNTGLKAKWGQGQTPEMPKIAFAQSAAAGPDCSWVSHLNTTTDYGVAWGSTQHTVTMNWNDMKEKERRAAIDAQQASDVWRHSTPGPYGPYPNCNAEKENAAKVGNVPAPKSPERPDQAPHAPTAAFGKY